MYINKKARHVMVPVSEYPVIYEDTPVSEAIRLMRESFHQKDGTWYGFQSMLVVNRKEELVGILTLRSLLKAFKIRAMQDHFTKGDPTGMAFWPHFNSSFEITAWNIMRPLSLVMVQEDSDIFEAIVLMVKKKINSLPVMSGTELVGIVRTIDLFWTVGEFLD